MTARKLKADRDKRYGELLDQSIKQHKAWVEQFEREKELLAQFPIVKAEVASIKTWCEEHDAAHREERAKNEKYRLERERRDLATDAKLDAILDIKSKAVFLWRVAKLIAGIAVFVLGVLKIILPFLRPVVESWIKHIAGK